MKKILAAAAVLLTALAVNAVNNDVDDAKLTEALTQAREQRLNDLHGYAEKGVFPHNHGNPGERIPYFMDRHGRLCAVGFLIAKSLAGEEWDYDRFMSQKNVARRHSGVGILMPGDEERLRTMREKNERYMKLFGFFNEIATTNNNIRIKDVHDGPVLDWILKSGLTQEEAAMIQPSYSYLACDDCLAGSQGRGRAFGRQSEESKRVEEEDRVRIQAHLFKVEELLRMNGAASLKTCAARLRARGKPWALMPRNL